MSVLKTYGGAYERGERDFRRAYAEAYPAPQIVSSAGREEVIARTRECDVVGCANLVMDGLRCSHCVDELRALRQNAEEARLRREARAERRGERARAAIEIGLVCWDWLRGVDWVSWALAAFVIAAFSYMGFVYGAMFFGE